MLQSTNHGRFILVVIHVDGYDEGS